MTVIAEQVGRDLHLTVEGAGAPFVIRPLPAPAGRALTAIYLDLARGMKPENDLDNILMYAADGVDENGDWILDGPVYTDIDTRLSLAEAQDVLLPALFWQTVLGIKGVNTYLNSGGGDVGSVKALWSLVSTLGISAPLTSPPTALETLIPLLASSLTTPTPQGGEKPGKQPQDRRPPQ